MLLVVGVPPTTVKSCWVKPLSTRNWLADEADRMLNGDEPRSRKKKDVSMPQDWSWSSQKPRVKRAPFWEPVSAVLPPPRVPLLVNDAEANPVMGAPMGTLPAGVTSWLVVSTAMRPT